jgi:hypothetical protein
VPTRRRKRRTDTRCRLPAPPRTSPSPPGCGRLAPPSCSRSPVRPPSPPTPAPDCDAPGFARTLQPVPARNGLPREARALWLSRALIRWPGATPGARHRLYHTRNSGLRLDGGRVLGADGALDLQAAAAPPPPALAQRFRYAGDGPLLALAAATRRSCPNSRAGNSLLVEEDASGKLLQATGLQLAGLLDDLYAGAADAPALGATLADTSRCTACGRRRRNRCGCAPMRMPTRKRTQCWRCRSTPPPVCGRWRVRRTIAVATTAISSMCRSPVSAWCATASPIPTRSASAQTRSAATSPTWPIPRSPRPAGAGRPRRDSPRRPTW